MGRPSEYSPEIAARICDLLSEGRSVRSVCQVEDMPAPSTVFKWLSKHPEFAEQYARAREASIESLADSILEISDDGENDTYVDDEGMVRTAHDVIQRSKLRVDSRKWLLSKLAPKKYGDKLDVTADIKGPFDGIPATKLAKLISAIDAVEGAEGEDKGGGS